MGVKFALLLFAGKQGFLEFSSHKEAQSMVNHFQLKPAFIKENPIILYLSPTVEGIYVSRNPTHTSHPLLITPSILRLTIYPFIMDFLDSNILFAYI